MKINGKIKEKKLQYNIHGEAAKISALSSRKINIFQFFRGEEILPHDQRGVTEQPKFAHSSSEKAFEKQTKAIEEQRFKRFGYRSNPKQK